MHCVVTSTQIPLPYSPYWSSRHHTILAHSSWCEWRCSDPSLRCILWLYLCKVYGIELLWIILQPWICKCRRIRSYSYANHPQACTHTSAVRTCEMIKNKCCTKHFLAHLFYFILHERLALEFVYWSSFVELLHVGPTAPKENLSGAGFTSPILSLSRHCSKHNQGSSITQWSAPHPIFCFFFGGGVKVKSRAME